MSNKNPFEIRLDVLAMAKDYMDKVHAANVELAEKLAETGNKSTEKLQQMMTMYTPEELLKQAEEFYSNFICKK